MDSADVQDHELLRHYARRGEAFHAVQPVIILGQRSDHFRKAAQTRINTGTRRAGPASSDDSFSVNDAPPRPTEGGRRDQHFGDGVVIVSGARRSVPGVVGQLVSLGGAGIVAVGFGFAILIVGSAVALSVRLGVEAITWIAALFR